MQIVISPAKSLDFKTLLPYEASSNFRFPREAKELVHKLNSYSVNKLCELMKVSHKLAELNFMRFKEWQHPFDAKNARQAVFAFKGDVFQGMDVYSLSKKDVDYMQQKLRILSGLYGLLRPLDLILPYRLEMGTKLPVGRSKDLYAFWGSKITDLLKRDMADNHHKVLINLASNEYFKALKVEDLNTTVVTPAFKDLINGEYKIISFYAKKARGLMTRFIVKNKIEDPEQLKTFDLDRYYYNSRLSTDEQPVFTRDH